MTTSEKKKKLLGMSHGKAAHRLWRAIMFRLIQQTKQDTCYRCNKPIETLEEFSIEHKEPWQHAKNPREVFFDLNNIAFSHKICNSRHGNSLIRTRLGNRTIVRKNRKITSEQAMQIKQFIQAGDSDRTIASRFGVNPKTIYMIRSGVTFKYIT
jgi:DNA-binding CsgD family transcriptional regulator